MATHPESMSDKEDTPARACFATIINRVGSGVMSEVLREADHRLARGETDAVQLTIAEDDEGLNDPHATSLTIDAQGVTFTLAQAGIPEEGQDALFYLERAVVDAMLTDLSQ